MAGTDIRKHCNVYTLRRFLCHYLCGITVQKFLLMSLVFSAGIEITQYITGRGLCEFDDVFNNTLGACVGFTSWRLKMRPQ
ncbi:MAG: VanZ family protein [Ruminococcus sp.]